MSLTKAITGMQPQTVLTCWGTVACTAAAAAVSAAGGVVVGVAAVGGAAGGTPVPGGRVGGAVPPGPTCTVRTPAVAAAGRDSRGPGIHLPATGHARVCHGTATQQYTALSL